MTTTHKRRRGKRVPRGNHQSVRVTPEPPDPLPECHPCHGCSAVDLRGNKLFCFLPACLREELEKPLCQSRKEEKSHA